MTIREAIAETNNVLTSLDASLLLAEVLGISRSSLIAAASRPLSAAALTAFNGLVKRRLAGECVAYILGRKEFYGLEFMVNHSVLVPRPETETLVHTALAEISKLAIKNQPPLVLDLCTGSGAVAIALEHEMPQLEVWATDISAEAIAVAQTNAARLLPEETINFRQGDLYDALTDNKQHSLFSIITSNPPYVSTAVVAGLSPEVRREPLIALDGGDDGLALIKRIISRAPEFLCPGGVVLLEADPQQMKQIGALLIQAGFTDIQTHNDLSGEQRVIKGKKN